MISKAVESQIIDWVKSIANFTNPLAIHWCDGSEAEARRLEQEMMSRGSLMPLDSRSVCRGLVAILGYRSCRGLASNSAALA